MVSTTPVEQPESELPDLDQLLTLGEDELLTLLGESLEPDLDAYRGADNPLQRGRAWMLQHWATLCAKVCADPTIQGMRLDDNSLRAVELAPLLAIVVDSTQARAASAVYAVALIARIGLDSMCAGDNTFR